LIGTKVVPRLGHLFHSDYYTHSCLDARRVFVARESDHAR